MRHSREDPSTTPRFDTGEGSHVSSLTGQVNIFPFDIQTLRTIFCVEPNASATVEYLGGYLRDIGVCTILHEQVYMDRHYLDEFAEYYSRSFRRAEAPCQRALFFASTPDLTQAAYNQTLEIGRAHV